MKNSDRPAKAVRSKVSKAKTQKQPPLKQEKKKTGPETNTSWHERFISEMNKFPNVSAACEVCGISWSTAHRHKTFDADFSDAWDAAKRKAADLLEQAAIERATHGTLRPIYQGGVKVGAVRECSDTLAAFLLKGLKPETYGDRSKVEFSGKVTMTDEEIVEASKQTHESLLLTMAASMRGAKP